MQRARRQVELAGKVSRPATTQRACGVQGGTRQVMPEHWAAMSAAECEARRAVETGRRQHLPDAIAGAANIQAGTALELHVVRVKAQPRTHLCVHWSS